MFKIEDIVKYKTPFSPSGMWGIITDILEVKSSIYKQNEDETFFRIQPLENGILSYYDATEKDILESYSRYFKRNITE